LKHFRALHSWVGSWPNPQTLDKAGQEKNTLAYDKKIKKFNNSVTGLAETEGAFLRFWTGCEIRCSVALPNVAAKTQY